jgi:hypothetical protein
MSQAECGGALQVCSMRVSILGADGGPLVGAGD